MGDLLYADETYRLRGACFEVHKEKGCGFLEAVFQECLEVEFSEQGIPFQPHPLIRLSYKRRPLRQTYPPDFLCFGKIILEIKAVTALADEHRAQIHNYLRATGHRLGLLVSFGHFPRLELERIIV